MPRRYSTPDGKVRAANIRPNTMCDPAPSEKGWCINHHRPNHKMHNVFILSVAPVYNLVRDKRKIFVYPIVVVD
jgi:hypothetical protein